MNAKVSVIQMVSAADLSENLSRAGALLEIAAGQGAVLAALPENFAFTGARERDKLPHAEQTGGGPIQDFLAATASRLGLWIVAGSVPMAVPDEPNKVYAACLVYQADGALAARYDKIHLFDVAVERNGKLEHYRESSSIAHGAPSPAVVQTPAGRLGLSICYDLRFPELYRALSEQGAELLCVPSAFTAKTGEAHWSTLLRARAVENLCYVLAPNQGGVHPGGSQTWGHSMIVSPWGQCLAEADGGEAVVNAEIDLNGLQSQRQRFPALDHRRL